VVDILACDHQLATVRLVGAGDDLDERGFSRAVFAEQGVDFARKQLERNAPERADGSEGFANVSELEEGFQSVWRAF
jgi:hypothetical protein